MAPNPPGFLAHPRAPAGDEMRLLVEGREYRREQFVGWSDVQVTRRIDSAAGAFKVSLVSRRPFPIGPGSPVEVRLGDDPILTGHVDSMDGSVDASARSSSVSGRDLAADLIDCSYPEEPGEWHGLKLLALCRELARPFDLKVTRGESEFAEEPFATWKVQQGESAWASIERAVRQRGRLAFSLGDGTLRIAKPGEDRADVELVEGQNVEKAKFKWTQASRFRVYIVRGQRRGSDDEWGESVAAIEGRSEDLEIDRFRPLLILADGQVTASTAAELAAWEATVRAARSFTVDVEVQGWRQTAAPDAPIWRPNLRVRTRIPSLELDLELLVNAVKYVRSGDGTRTTLQLIRRDAYQPKPTIERDSAIESIVESGVEDEDL